VTALDNPSRGKLRCKDEQPRRIAMRRLRVLVPSAIVFSLALVLLANLSVA